MLNQLSPAALQYLFISAVVIFEILLYVFYFKKSFPWVHGLSSLVVAACFAFSNVYSKPLEHKFYHLISDYQLFSIEITEIWHFCALFFAMEFVHYWIHRTNHTFRIFWLEHNVHHAVTEVNFLTGLQKSALGLFTPGWMMWGIFFVFGVELKIFLLVKVLSSTYNFLLHNTWVPKLGWLEYFFNTPSHHRVHHASNPIYANKNFGNVIIIYDRLFGTFQEELETEACRYGYHSMTKSRNPFKVICFEWLRLIRSIGKVRVK